LRAQVQPHPYIFWTHFDALHNLAHLAAPSFIVEAV